MTRAPAKAWQARVDWLDVVRGFRGQNRGSLGAARFDGRLRYRGVGVLGVIRIFKRRMVE